jgi:hypothetical protein
MILQMTIFYGKPRRLYIESSSVILETRFIASHPWKHRARFSFQKCDVRQSETLLSTDIRQEKASNLLEMTWIPERQQVHLHVVSISLYDVSKMIPVHGQYALCLHLPLVDSLSAMAIHSF